MNRDLTQYFAEFDGDDYRQFVQQLERDMDAMLARDPAPWVQFLTDYEALGARADHVGSYLACLSAADANNEKVTSEVARIDALGARMEKISVIVQAGLRDMSDDAFNSLLNEPALDGAQFMLKTMRERGKRRMESELEMLAAELGIDGISAWGRLYDQISGRLEFELKLPDGTCRKVPMSQKISLIEDPDPAVRKATLAGSNAAWASMEDVVAGAINAIAGWRLTLDKWRGVDHFLDVALFDAHMSRKTLDTMLDTIRSRADIPRRYLRLKARVLGKTRLGFQDLSAPLPLETPERISWEQARARVHGSFARVYPELGQFVDDALTRRWVDSEPRQGKRPGAFCTGSTMLGESRVFMTFNHTPGDVQTLAHELGHAFHSHTMRQLRPWAQHYPMTLAESASTFAETLLTEALLEDPNCSEQTRAVVLDTRMEQAAAYMLNIPMRYIFEKAFYEERKQGEVPSSRLQAIMLDAQRECYRDTLDESEMDPWFWASKLHFYIAGLRFYNYPYAFGFLFSMGVFARFKQEGPGFLRQYEELLRLTGSDTVEGVAQRALGVDLTKPDFWNGSIDLIEQDMQRFTEIIEKSKMFTLR